MIPIQKQIPKDLEPLTMDTSPSGRYLPCFNSVKNITWWEYYPTHLERMNEGWVTVTKQKKYHSTRKNKNNDDGSDKRHKNKEKDDIEEQRNIAWKRLHKENSRREELLKLWLAMQKD